MWRTVASVALVLVGVALIVLSLAHTAGVDVEKAVVEYCRSPEALRWFTPLVVGMETKIRFRFDGRELIADVGNVHTEVVATVALGKVYIRNADLWDLFEWYCTQQNREEYVSKVSAYSSLSLAGSILLASVGAWLLLNQLKKRKPTETWSGKR
ncbi:MAG: hypothetical protein QXL83_08315 [Zestosphaera sp.]